MTKQTIKNYLTNDGTVNSFFKNEYDKGNAQGENDSSVYYEGDILYSFGYHFVLAQKHEGNVFVNADRYSNTTNKHQALVQKYCPSKGKIEIPFSALEKAGLRVKYLEVVDTQESKWIPIQKENDKGEMIWTNEHLMGSSVFKFNDRYFLSSLDSTAKDVWNGYFLTELIKPCHTIEEAYASLKPENVKILESFHVEVIRQGEYFFAPVENKESLLILKAMEKNKTVEKRVALVHDKHDKDRSGLDLTNSRHIVTNYAKIGNMQFAKGTCRHSGGEHKMLKIPSWHVVIENNQVQSWSSDGRID